MGDVIRADEIETCKENIQPLREGRRTSTLKKILTVTKTVEDVEKERQYVAVDARNRLNSGRTNGTFHKSSIIRMQSAY